LYVVSASQHPLLQIHELEKALDQAVERAKTNEWARSELESTKAANAAWKRQVEDMKALLVRESSDSLRQEQERLLTIAQRDTEINSLRRSKVSIIFGIGADCAAVVVHGHTRIRHQGSRHALIALQDVIQDELQKLKDESFKIHATLDESRRSQENVGAIARIENKQLQRDTDAKLEYLSEERKLLQEHLKDTQQKLVRCLCIY
jgi:hypothetical protein